MQMLLLYSIVQVVVVIPFIFFSFYSSLSFFMFAFIFLRCRKIQEVISSFVRQKNTQQQKIFGVSGGKKGRVNKENHSITCNYKKFTLSFVCLALLFRNHLISFFPKSVECFSLSSLFTPIKSVFF